MKAKEPWSRTHLRLMYGISHRSDDPDTKVGAVIVDRHNRIVSMGFNGLPKGTRPLPERLTRRDGAKYLYMVHADTNAIAFAHTPLNGCEMYLPRLPCMLCAGLIINSGITSVCVHDDYQRRYMDAGRLSFKEKVTIERYLAEGGVRVQYISDDSAEFQSHILSIRVAPEHEHAPSLMSKIKTRFFK